LVFFPQTGTFTVKIHFEKNSKPLPLPPYYILLKKLTT